MCYGWYIIFSSGVFIKEKTIVLYKITLSGAAITVVSNILLIPWLGMYGAAVATLLSYTVMALLLGNYSKRVMYVPYRLPERSEEHTSELQSRGHLVCRLLLEKKEK